MLKKKAVVIHSGGMDSSICLALAMREFGKEDVLSLSFQYGQRHSVELVQADYICREWGVDHIVVPLNYFDTITDHSALINPEMEIVHEAGKPPNTEVLGRNGIMAHLGAIHAHLSGAGIIYMGVLELEAANSGYRDCSRKYIDLMQEVIRLDLGNPDFEIRTPLIFMTKLETMQLAEQLDVVDFLLEHTVTCYEGVRGQGCEKCPACLLRNEGIEKYWVSKGKFRG